MFVSQYKNLYINYIKFRWNIHHKSFYRQYRVNEADLSQSFYISALNFILKYLSVKNDNHQRLRNFNKLFIVLHL